MAGFKDAANRMGSSLGTKIGEDYTKQGKSWDEVSSMPSSGGGFMGEALHSGVKTGYDNYMTKNKPQDTGSSSNMIQSSVGSNGGLAASAVDVAPQPTLTSGVQNPIADGTQFGNRTNGLGVMDGLAGSSFRNNFQNKQGMQNQYGIIGGASLI